jgi:hypothetical protein
MYPVTGVDGVQAVARFNVGDSVITVQPSYGRTKGSYALSTLDTTIDLKLKNLASILVNWEMGSWTFHVGASQTNLETHLNHVPGVISIPFGPTIVLNDLIPHDGETKERMSNAGVVYDNGKAIFQAEYVVRDQNPGGYENEGYYVMGGWRFGKVTPYYVYGHYTPKDDTAGLRNGNSHSVGFRYDVTDSIAIKAQFEHRDPINLFFNRLPGHPDTPVTSNMPPEHWEEETKKINVVSVAVDFVF